MASQPLMSTKEFLDRFKKAKAIRTQWESLLRDAYKYNIPDRQLFNNKQKGKDNQSKVFDDTSMRSLQKFSNNLKQKLMPAGQQWARLETSGILEAERLKGLTDDDTIKSIQLALDRNSEILFTYIHDSNFDATVLESLMDMAISTGALMIQDTGDVDKPITFISVPSDQLVIEECTNSDYMNVWREREIKMEDIQVEWPDYKQDSKLERLINDKPTDRCTIIEGTLYDYDKDEFKYMVHCDKAQNKIIYESRYKVSPWVIFRWNKSAGEVWGRGPALQCLPSVRYLNNLKQDILKNNAMATNPPLVINPSKFANPNSIRIAPNVLLRTKADWMGSNAPVQPLFNGSNIQTAVQSAQELQQDIRETFYVDSFGSVDSPVRSATEISIRNADLVEQQQSAFSRLQQELISKIIRRCYYILSERYDILEKIPDLNSTKITSVSPLARSQSMKDIESVTQMFGTMAQLFGEQALPALAATIKLEDLPEFFAQSFDIPAELRMSKEESQQKMAAMSQAAQGMAQQQMPQQVQQ